MSAPTRAMILAAGLGTRLRPLTNDRPKALVELAGRTLLDITLARLRAFGIHDVIINVHHFADRVADYLRAHQNFGMHLELSREDDLLLDTGGGLKQAAHFFLGSANPGDAPFLVHNVDVLSNIDLAGMLEFHNAQHALATLAVQTRETSRYLLFDDDLDLCGRRAGRDGPIESARPCANPQAFAFAGVHVISPRLLPMLTEDGAFSIIPSYLRLAAEGETIQAFPADDYYWRDLGKPETLLQAEEDIKKGLVEVP